MKIRTRAMAWILVCSLCLMTGCSFPADILPAWHSEDTDPPETPAVPDPPATDVPPVTDPPADDTGTDAPPAESTDGGEETTDLPEESAAEDTAPPEEQIPEDIVILPNLIGQNISAVETMSLPRTEIQIVHEPYSLPAGTIFDAVFEGTRSDTQFLLVPHTPLILHVSTGTPLANVTVPAEDKTFYLTFDDGPSPKYTQTVLDILDAYGIKGTFFLVGEQVQKYPELVKEISDRGHAIGCHSYSHKYDHIYADAENLRAEIRQWEEAVTAALGFVPEERLFRFPGGSTTCKNADIEKMLAEEGFRSFDWNAVNNDCMQHTRPDDMTAEEYIKDSVVTSVAYSFRLKTSPHILLMHDTYAQTAELLPWTIDYLTEQGCSFGTLDQLPGSWLH